MPVQPDTISPPFEGTAISLRPFEAEDVEALYALINHPDLTGRRYLHGDLPELAPLSRRQVQALYEQSASSKDELHLVVALRPDGRLIGYASLEAGWDPHDPSISLVIAPQQQCRGYGTEAAQLMLRYFFEYTPAHVVTSWVADWNTAGRQFMRKCGFQEAGRMRRAGILQGRYFDMVIHDLLRSEWEQGAGGGSYGA